MNIRTPVQLGSAIRLQRKLLGLDQAALAARIGTSRQWVIALEKGHARAEFGLVLRAVNALKLAFDLLPPNPRPRNRHPRPTLMPSWLLQEKTIMMSDKLLTLLNEKTIDVIRGRNGGLTFYCL